MAGQHTNTHTHTLSLSLPSCRPAGQHLYLIFVVMTYSSSMPLLYVLAAVHFATCYLSEKYELLKICKVCAWQWRGGCKCQLKLNQTKTSGAQAEVLVASNNAYGMWTEASRSSRASGAGD